MSVYELGDFAACPALTGMYDKTGCMADDIVSERKEGVDGVIVGRTLDAHRGRALFDCIRDPVLEKSLLVPADPRDCSGDGWALEKMRCSIRKYRDAREKPFGKSGWGLLEDDPFVVRYVEHPPNEYLTPDPTMGLTEAPLLQTVRPCDPCAEAEPAGPAPYGHRIFDNWTTMRRGQKATKPLP